MRKLSSFLDKFRNLLASETGTKRAVIEIIKEITGGELEKSDIRISEGTLYIQTGPVLKSEIFVKKRTILEKLDSFLGHGAPKDIR